MNEFEIDIEEGHPYPGWREPFEASILNITSEGLHLLTSIPFPRPVDILEYRNLTGYGIYHDKYPLAIWKFGKNFLLPTPCNPDFERQQNPEETELFFERLPSRFSRALIDVHGIIRVLAETNLNKEFIEKLHELWTAPGADWMSYNNWLMYTFQTGTHILWKRAVTFDLHGEA